MNDSKIEMLAAQWVANGQPGGIGRIDVAIKIELDHMAGPDIRKFWAAVDRIQEEQADDSK